MTNGFHFHPVDCRNIRERYRETPHTIQDIADDIGVTYESVRYHIRGDCSHSVEVDPIPYTGDS